MRSTVYFLPPRISVTGSVGISTLPIFSCRPKATMRDSSDSLTFFSKPEYVWMMYHFMFGLAFSGTGWPGAPTSGWLLVPSVFCSSILPINPSTVLLTVLQHPLNSAPDCLVNHKKVHAKDDDRDDNHHGGRLHFLTPGKRDFPHFIADIREKTLGTPGELYQPGQQALLIASSHCCLCHRP